MKTTTGLLAAALLAGPAFAQGGDDCSAPTPITGTGPIAFDTTSATTSGFDGGGGCAVGSETINQDLFWTFTVPTTGRFEFDTFGSTFDTKLSVHRGSDCSATCDLYDDDNGGQQSFVSVGGLTAGDVLLIQIGGFGTAFGVGTLNINLVANNLCDTDDVYEENDGCTGAPGLGDGFYSGLNVEESDNDFFTVGVDAGATLTVDLFFIDDDDDIDLFLWDPAVECNSNIVGVTGAYLGISNSATDDEQVIYTNNTGAAQTVVIEVDMWTGSGCNTYDMQVNGSNGMGSAGGIGSVFCTSNPNSTGSNSTLTILGSTSVADNDVALSASVSPNSFGYYVTSRMSAPGVPVGSGVICLGGNLGRFNLAPQIKNSGATGVIELDTNASEWTVVGIPTSTGPYTAVAGTTTYFQCWHRDTDGMGGLTSNFTDGVALTWTP